MKKLSLLNSFSLLLFLFLTPLGLVQAQCVSTTALNLYWKGGDGDFNDPNRWWVGSFNSGISPCQAPRSEDNVFFEAAAFAASSTSNRDTIYLTANASCASMWCDPMITASQNPVLFSANNNALFLDVYGSWTLSPHLLFFYQGTLRFRAPAGNYDLNSAGQDLRAQNILIEGDCGANYYLQGDFSYAAINPGNSVVRALWLNSGILHTQGHNLRLMNFVSTNTTGNFGCRGLFMDNSTMEMMGAFSRWLINFNANGSNHQGFSANNSMIEFSNTATNSTRYFQGGTNLNFHHLISRERIDLSGNPIFNHSWFYGRPYLTSGVVFTSEVFSILADLTCLFWNNAMLITNQLDVMNNSCGKLTIFTAAWSSNISSGRIRKRNAQDTLVLDQVALFNINPDTTGERFYRAERSMRRGGLAFSPPQVVINQGLGQDFVFRNRGDLRWHNPLNWDVWNGTAYIPNTAAGCVPSYIDRVYFDVNSFTAAGQRVMVDSISHCARMEWLSGVAANTGFSVANAATMNVWGSLLFDGAMDPTTAVNGLDFNLYGRGQGQEDSLYFPDSVRTWNNMIIQSYAEYRLMGDGDASTLDWNGYFIYAYRFSILRAEEQYIRAQRFYFSGLELHNVYVQSPYQSSIWFDYGDAKQYTGNTTFHSTWVGVGTAVSPQRGTYPNVIIEGFSAWESHPSAVIRMTIQGDLRLNGAADWGTGTRRIEVNVAGVMAAYSGNLYLAAGRTYSIGSHPSSFVRVSGAVLAQGDCQNFIQINSAAGSAVEFSIQDVANTQMMYVSLVGLNASASAAMVPVVSSVDGGENTNWNFLGGAISQTYYWRAHHTNPTYIGNWSDPGHWTLNPLSIVGDSLCFPTANDTVVFDSLSFGGTLANSGCIVNGTQYCKTFWMKANVRVLSTANGVGNLYISESLLLDGQMSNFLFNGSLFLIGNGGEIRTGSTRLPCVNFICQSPTAVWQLTDSLFVGNPNANATFNNYGRFYLRAGQFNTNGHYVYIRGFFTDDNRSTAKRLNLGQSLVEIAAKSNTRGSDGAVSTSTTDLGFCVWGHFNTSTEVIADSAHLVFLSGGIHGSATPVALGVLSPSTYYERMSFLDVNKPAHFTTVANVGYADFHSGATFVQDTRFDSIRLTGGNFYRIAAGRTLTLNAPHGKIIDAGGPGQFIHIESTIPGTSGFIYKDHGNAFCIDYVKVRDNQGRKQTDLALVPAAWQALHTILLFETGTNSDNIGGTATGIWDFSLPVLHTPSISGSTNIELCGSVDSERANIPLRGTSPYIVDYSWVDNLGNSGMRSDTLADDDANPFTDYIFRPAFSANPLATQTVYTISLASFRCGERTPATSPVTVTVSRPGPNLLVMQNRVATCELFNDPLWHSFVDPVDKRPILSLFDQVNALDEDSLKLVEVEVRIEPTVPTWAGGPYLQRHWRVTPQNNSPARVRLYFTEQEMENLRMQTFVASLNRRMNPLTELRVRKFESGVVGLGPSVIIPHDTLTWTAAQSAPFTSINNLIGFEFEVSGFSAFIIEPTDEALLSLSLLDFRAQAQASSAKLSWQVGTNQDLAYFVLERSGDATQGFEPLAQIPASSAQNYDYLDAQPLTGENYYRLALIGQDGQREWSPVRILNFAGAKPQISLYPNPSQGALQLDFGQVLERGHWVCYNALGQSLAQGSFEGQMQLNLDFSHLAPGLYILSLDLPGLGRQNLTWQRD